MHGQDGRDAPRGPRRLPPCASRSGGRRRAASRGRARRRRPRTPRKRASLSGQPSPVASTYGCGRSIPGTETRVSCPNIACAPRRATAGRAHDGTSSSSRSSLVELDSRRSREVRPRRSTPCDRSSRTSPAAACARPPTAARGASSAVAKRTRTSTRARRRTSERVARPRAGRGLGGTRAGHRAPRSAARPPSAAPKRRGGKHERHRLGRRVQQQR